MKGLALALAAALGFLLAGAGWAEVQKCPSRPGSPGMPTAQWTQPQFRMQPWQTAQVEGQVSAVAPDRQLLSLEWPDGGVESVQVTPRTRILFPDGNLASFADLKEGQRVRASYRLAPSGQRVADEVDILEMGPPEGGLAAPESRGAAPGGGEWKDR